MISQEQLKEELNYDRNTGVFTRAKANNRRFKVGEEVGYTVDGYKMSKVLGKSYMLHRLAWLYEYGVLPTEQIDHIDHDRTNNRISNLRLVKHSDNAKNQTKRCTNTSGHTGVVWNKANQKWIAQIKVDYKYKYLGSFENKEKAIEMRKQAEIEYGFHKNHGKDK